MADFSERLLEFDAVKQMLRAYVGSAPGRAAVAGLAPRADLEEIERQHRLTAEVRVYWRGGGRFDFSGLADCQDLLGRSRITGSALDLSELREVLNLADRAQSWRQIGLSPPETLTDGWPTVEELTRGLSDFAPLLGYFKNKILPDGTLDDRASPELARLRDRKSVV